MKHIFNPPMKPPATRYLMTNGDMAVVVDTPLERKRMIKKHGFRFVKMVHDFNEAVEISKAHAIAKGYEGIVVIADDEKDDCILPLKGE